MNALLAIGIGGGLGAMLRHGLNFALTNMLPGPFPYGIMLINIIGSLAMGILIGLFAHFEQAQLWKLFLTTGILGGFTTFSAFSLDSVLLLERGAYGAAALYIAGSVGLSLVALTFGLWGTRLWLT